MKGHDQSTIESDSFDTEGQPIAADVPIPARSMQRRRKKFRRFLVLETTALVILIASASAGVSERFADESLTSFFEIITVAAALAVGVIPVVFYGLPRRDYPIRKYRR